MALNQRIYLNSTASGLMLRDLRWGGEVRTHSARPLPRPLPHLLPAKAQYLGGVPLGDAFFFKRLTHQARQSVLDQIVSGEPSRLPRPAPVPRELARAKSLRLVGFPERFAEMAAMLTLERAPDLGPLAPGFHQPVEHGLVAHTEAPLDLEDPYHQLVPACVFTFRSERRFGHQDFARERVCFSFRLKVRVVQADRPGRSQPVSEYSRPEHHRCRRTDR